MKILSVILSFIMLFAPQPSVPNAVAKTGGLRVLVKDFSTNAPIENATVCVVEFDSYFKTDEHGYTKVITAPILPNQNFNSSNPRPFGEVTLLVYKEGYVDYLLFYAMISENKVRLGPTILLYPKTKGLDEKPHIILESPDNAWAEGLISKYKR